MTTNALNLPPEFSGGISHQITEVNCIDPSIVALIMQKQFERIRLGKVTASEAASLFTADLKIAQNTTSRGYILRKAVEKITQKSIKESFSAEATDWGNRYEPFAVTAFQEKTGYVVTHHGTAQRFMERCETIEIEDENGIRYYEIEVGGHPDGFVEDALEGIAQAEIKCPANIAVHLENLENEGNVAFLKKERTAYWVQMQTNMFCADAKRCYFISFSPNYWLDDEPKYQQARLHLRDESRLAITIVERDDEFIFNKKNGLIVTVASAIQGRNAMVEKYQKYFR